MAWDETDRDIDRETRDLLRQLVEENRLQGYTLSEISRHTFWLALVFSFVVAIVFIFSYLFPEALS